jgi:anti-sigma regulatory factor (Ser/Thr protein kinase)
MSHNLANTILEIPNSLDYLPLCAAFIESNSCLIGFDPDEVQAIVLATDEAISNIILHAYAPGQYDTIKIECWQTPLGIEIIIKEKGMPVDTNKFPEYDPDSIAITKDSSGLGLYLIKQTIDEIIFTNRGSEGRETHLIKYLCQCPVEEMLQSARQDDQREAPEKKSTGVTFSIRKLAGGETIEISRAIYRVYGYNYFNEHAYYPERLERLTKSGQLETVVAVTGGGIFAGTCSIYQENLNLSLGELEQAVVLPDYRGNHLMEQMLQFLRRAAEAKELMGLFAKSETSDIYSQRALQRLDARDCALLLGLGSRQVTDKNSPDQQPQRESMLLSYLPLNKGEPRAVYVPEHHLAMIKKIYDNIGYKRDYLTPKRGKEPFHDATELNIKYYYNTSTAIMKVSMFGKDFIRKLKEAKKEVKLKKFAVIYLYLGLDNPFTARFFEKIENLDFFFAGILPYGNKGDEIILQYLNNVEIKIDELVLYTDFAKEIAEYVKQCRVKDPMRLLIDGGEDDKLEFKSTLQWNLKENRKDSRMSYTVLKSMTAFLNTEGGTLLVGVQDDGSVLGIEIENFPNDDKYLLHFSHLVQHNIGLDSMPLINFYLIQLEGRKILKIDCEPSAKPVFLKIENQEDFYIRSGPASKKLAISEAVSYIAKRF